MERLPRKIYTYEFKQEAVRLVESGQSVAEMRTIGASPAATSIWPWHLRS
jgi:transposase-like protein